MKSTLVVARNTFREAIRDRLVTTVLVFGGVIVASSVILAPLTLGEESRIIRDLGLTSISLFSILLIVMVGTGMVYREIERRTIYTILTLPVRRAEFILGKFLGLTGTVLLSIGILSLIYLLIVAAYGGGIQPNVFWALGMTALEITIVTAVAIFFSTVASPLLSAVFTFFIYVAGHLAGDLKILTEQCESALVRGAADGMYLILPSLHQFDVRNNLLSGIGVPLGQVGYCLAYTVLFTAAVLLVTIAAFQRRDFE